MLVRYRVNSSCTIENFKTDINNIILGNVTTVSNLSAGADQTNSEIYGTYPTAIYARVNGTTYTYSKLHNSFPGAINYVRLTFDSTKMTTIALAQSYTSGTDTLVNSYALTVNLLPVTFSSVLRNGIDIIVSDKILAFFAPEQSVLTAIVDLGNTTTTRNFTDSMLMMMQDFTNVPEWGKFVGGALENTGGVIPYSYSYDTNAYGTVITGIGGVSTALKTFPNGDTVVFENPLFCTGGGATNLMYGCFRVPRLTFNGLQLYKDSANLYRLTIFDNSILVD
jgi:hypothetical protein